MNTRTAACVLTRNDPASLNACLWSIAMQSTPPNQVFIVNTGEGFSRTLSGSLDLLSSRVAITVLRIPNTPQNHGEVHARMFQTLAPLIPNSARRVWFFQDDVVAHPHALEALLAYQRRTLAPAVIPTIITPGVTPLSHEEITMPQTRDVFGTGAVAPGLVPTHGMAVGMLFRAKHLPRVQAAVAPFKFGIDTAMIAALEPRHVPRAVVYHTREIHPIAPPAIVQVQEEFIHARVKACAST